MYAQPLAPSLYRLLRAANVALSEPRRYLCAVQVLILYEQREQRVLRWRPWLSRQIRPPL